MLHPLNIALEVAAFYMESGVEMIFEYIQCNNTMHLLVSIEWTVLQGTAVIYILKISSWIACINKNWFHLNVIDTYLKLFQS